MSGRILIYIAIAVVILSGLTFYLVQQNIFIDEKARVDAPIAPAASNVEPVLEIVAEDLGLLWAIDFLPGTPKLLANEKSGSIFLIDTETLEVVEITGAPEVASSGQGGLLDLAVSPAFGEDNLIYLTYSAANEAGETTTHLARAVLDLDELRLNSLEVLYVAEPFLRSSAHYGSRVVIKGEHLYMTIGDRGDKDFDNHVAQDTSNVLGTTIRLMQGGSIPEDNPFVGNPDILDEIYTYGHRNSQGMTIHPETGEIWQSEHGERDGDEINIIYGGNNYGWPIATYGCTYATRQSIGVFPDEREDTISPVHYWECGSGGFPPAGMTFYDADGFLE
ncbi:MAG: PQQ-dependent sugar dehydrogenase [Firmicutes bacterium]|nr:PQQ-dependent sugar dehydrogenase [Bacillota bacterium]